MFETHFLRKQYKATNLFTSLVLLNELAFVRINLGIERLCHVTEIKASNISKFVMDNIKYERNARFSCSSVFPDLFSVSSSFFLRLASSKRLCSRAIFSLSDPSWASFSILFSCCRRMRCSLWKTHEQINSTENSFKCTLPR